MPPPPNDLHIYYDRDFEYRPDFVVQTATGKYICETNGGARLKAT
jgi:hypothetical protein